MANTASKIWEAVRGELQVQVSKANYRTWLEKTVGITYEGNQFIVGVPNTFVAEYLSRNQHSLIQKALIGYTSADVQVQFQVVGRDAARAELPALSAAGPRFNPDYDFETFIEGPGNRLARAAAMAVAENPGRAYNPLFIYAGSGLGKTHLLHAIGHAALAKNMAIISVTGEQFTNEFITAIRERKTEEFRSKFRSTGILLVDDIHFIGGKEQTEESFFHTFNELHNANRQIVITSDRPPNSIPLLEERLRSRFEWGLTADIQPPDFETRLAILQAKARHHQANLDPQILEFIGQQIAQNIRELEGSLNRVLAYARLLQTLPTLDLAAKALRDVGTRGLPCGTPTPNRIIELVAESFQFTTADLCGPRRDKEAVLARRLAMYLMRQETALALARIGETLGGRDAAAVTNACKKMRADLKDNACLQGKTREIEQKLHPESKSLARI